MLLSLHMFDGFSDPAFWAAVAFVAFIAVLIWKKVPAAINKSLDERGLAIEVELEEAKKLRVEAENILADYQDKQKNAGQEVQSIVENAKREAQSVADETRQSMKITLARRLQSAEDRITQAERQAASEIRALAADLSVNAARNILKTDMASTVNDNLFSETLSDLKTKFN